MSRIDPHRLVGGVDADRRGILPELRHRGGEVEGHVVAVEGGPLQCIGALFPLPFPFGVGLQAGAVDGVPLDDLDE
ncbi:hypothetical protein QP028_11185 [Corynebacterium suedekumii]|nr:hypothetical protein QP028_11185 [Corynebacterium suedekumii]